MSPRYALDELARLGDLLYEREVAPRVSGEDTGRFVAIDVESGAYEIHRDELTAIDRMLARKPQAQLWLRRVGFPSAHRLRALGAQLVESPTQSDGSEGYAEMAADEAREAEAQEWIDALLSDIADEE